MKIAAAFWSIVAYVAFLISIVWAIVFLAGSMDKGVARGPVETLLVDIGLMGMFAVQHTLMSRTGFKKWLTRSVPAIAERSTFVLVASAILLVTFWQWRPEPALVWKLEWAPAEFVFWALYALGWLIVLGSTFMIDHLELFGLRHRTVEFRERWLYAWVRHPMMLGLIIAFWATPRMSIGHLLFAALSTSYILVGTLAFEEPDLRRALGPRYSDYAARVPAFVPRLRKRRSSTNGMIAPPPTSPSRQGMPAPLDPSRPSSHLITGIALDVTAMRRPPP